MVTAGAEMVVSYDPRTGKELWRANGTQSHPIPSAVAGHGLVILTAGSQAKRAMAIKLGGDGNLVDSPAIVWRYAKGTAYVPSPILVGPYLYLMTDGGIMTCLEAETGKLVYEGGRPPVPATFTASLVSFGDKLLATSEDGDTFMIRTGPRSRGAANELGRRAGLRVTRARRRHHLHPRRAASLRHQEVAEGLAPRTPLHALSRAASTARSVRVARSLRSLARL